MVDCDPSYQTVKSGIGERLSAQLTIDNDRGPMLPTGYQPMTAMAMIPSCGDMYSIRACGHGGGSFILKSKSGQPIRPCPINRQTARDKRP